ncbi:MULTISPECIES: hypothetical protein [unclassified Streptomyces]|uniref:hypothetical protein n=1 Tax=unclassified Streptomyces TaxID=2593676 RepID=UPI00190C8B28|nr:MULTISPECIES: hypothetical protein [unclassified Streptomyces]MBK3563199.1 hypothetical protein [Streptomyces sp. MBT62]MBK6013188.1 hypothetical protein [Streptomyces sp. MBT53]
MTAHRRTARTLVLGAGGSAAAGVYAATANSWFVVPGLYAAAFLAWCARCHLAAHHRQLAEQSWERRRVLGERPAALNPCCMLARHSDGAAHDRRCTDVFHRITADLRSST